MPLIKLTLYQHLKQSGKRHHLRVGLNRFVPKKTISKGRSEVRSKFRLWAFPFAQVGVRRQFLGSGSHLPTYFMREKTKKVKTPKSLALLAYLF